MEKNSFRKKFNLKPKIPIIGNVARFAPMKDHLNLLQSLSLLKQKNIIFFCLLAGSNIDKNNYELVNQLKKLNLFNHVKLLGRQKNITKIINTLSRAKKDMGLDERLPDLNYFKIMKNF